MELYQWQNFCDVEKFLCKVKGKDYTCAIKSNLHIEGRWKIISNINTLQQPVHIIKFKSPLICSLLSAQNWIYISSCPAFLSPPAWPCHGCWVQRGRRSLCFPNQWQTAKPVPQHRPGFRHPACSPLPLRWNRTARRQATHDTQRKLTDVQDGKHTRTSICWSLPLFVHTKPTQTTITGNWCCFRTVGSAAAGEAG